MTPNGGQLGGAVSRLDFTKTWRGELEATGLGVLLSCGDPSTEEAGYVAIETVDGRLRDLEGGFAFQQSAFMHGGSQTLRYEVAPGSGCGALEGMTGTLQLNIDEDGTHRYELDYDL